MYMNKNGYKEFKEKLKNEDFEKQLDAFLEENSFESQADRIRLIVQFAADKGYEVSEEELSAEAAGLRTLDDEEMDNLAGGEWCAWEYSCIVCAHSEGCEHVLDVCDRTVNL